MAATLWLAAFCAAAHHSLTMFDKTQHATLDGTIKDFDWRNPHVWIHLIVHDAARNRDVEWLVEGPNPSILMRSGWTPHTLEPGDKALVIMYPSRDADSLTGLLVSVTVNGQKVWKNPFEP